MTRDVSLSCLMIMKAWMLSTESTMSDGACFGKNSFDTFTHRRSFINVPAEYVTSFVRLTLVNLLFGV